MADPAVTDDQRKRLEDALAAALSLQYQNRWAQTLDTLGEDAGDVPAAAQKKINAFAADRAEKIQVGINQYVQSALDDLPDDATDEERQQAVDDQRQEIERYHDEVLMPYLARWADQQGLIDGWRDSGKVDAVQWVWQRNTTAPPDECQAAADASPAPLDDLLSIAGGDVPVHPRCACQTYPYTA